VTGGRGDIELRRFDPLPPRRAGVPETRPVAPFSLLRADGTGFRAFDPARNGLRVAGMLRHAVRRGAETSGWPAEKIARFVLGHEPDGGAGPKPVGPRRFAYLPVPSIELRGAADRRIVGPIRRALLTTFADDAAPEIEWARRALSGIDLVRESDGQPDAMLAVLPLSEACLGPYLRRATTWTTVTPIVLPGFDDPDHLRRRAGREDVDASRQQRMLAHLDARIERLLRKAIANALFPAELVNAAELDWRDSGYLAGVDLARRYGVPNHLRRYPRLHVTIRWRDPKGQPVQVPGPVCIGSGRFLGIGLMVATE
jgi:CRISPR-associated protein Csb2